MTSYLKILDKLETFCDNHKQVFKFGSDFLEQLPNFATKNEKFPLVFVVPTTATPTDILTNISVDIYCLDIIQKGRENINTILSDTQLILNDIYLELNTGEDWDYDVTSASMLPLNNDVLDYAAGWVLSISLEGQTYCYTEIPD